MKTALIAKLFTVVVVVVGVCEAKKLYVMAHRVNTKSWIDYAIKWGSNAIECDVTKEKGKLYAFHGDTGGWEHFDTFLDHARARLQSDPMGRRVSLWIFDIKYTAKDGIGTADINNIRRSVQNRLLNPVNGGANPSSYGLYVMYGMYGKYSHYMEASMKSMPLQSREGINYDADVYSQNVDPATALAWKAKHRITNFFYSAGSFAFGTAGYQTQLARAKPLRSRHAFGLFAWTFNSPSSAAQKVKTYNMDGVMGNVEYDFGYLTNKLNPSKLGYYGLSGYTLVGRGDRPPFLDKA